MKRKKSPLRKRPQVWLLAAQAAVLSGCYRWTILHRPFSELSPKIGTLGLETGMNALDENRIREVQYAVIGVCRRTPWESLCLVQALTAKKLLNRQGLPCTLYMGVAKDSAGQLIAHAWVRCGNIIVTGGKDSPLRYAVTGIYGDQEELC